MANVFKTIIVQDSDVALARLLSETLAPVSGAGMYDCPISTTGGFPATHWISSGIIDSDYADLLDPDQSELISTLCAEAGFIVDADTVRGLLTRSDISQEPPFTAMARLGVGLITGGEL